MIKLLKWYYGTAKLRTKLVISYALVCVLPIIFISMYMYKKSESNYLERTKSSIDTAVMSMNRSLNSIIVRENDNIKYLTYNAEFRRQLEHASSDWTGFTKILTDRVEPVFWYFITSDTNLKWIKVYSSHLEKNIGNFCLVSEPFENEVWYQDVMDSSKIKWAFDKDKAYARCVVLDAYSSSMPIGIVELELYLDKLLSPLDISTNDESGAILMDGNGQLILSSKQNNSELLSNVEEYIKNNKNIDFDKTPEFVIAGSEPINNGWQLYYYRSSSDINNDLKDIKRTTLIILAGSFFVILFLASLMANILSERLNKLKVAAEEISKGNFDVPMETFYNDEIGVLNKSFYWMEQKMNEMISETYHLGLAIRKAEYQALRAKINPHFLYNCLSSIKWKAIKKGNDDIADITGMLAKFYRGLLTDDKAITTVKKELETVKFYVEILLKTHDNNFQVIEEFENENMNYSMPSFLLQPLIENAAIHGLAIIENQGKKEN
ncbi:MAG: histidine kinase [Lachnospiraceae bacterium]|nr:histidine kinase [Lachnospiraceae bacterium]